MLNAGINTTIITSSARPSNPVKYITKEIKNTTEEIPAYPFRKLLYLKCIGSISNNLSEGMGCPCDRIFIHCRFAHPSMVFDEGKVIAW